MIPGKVVDLWPLENQELAKNLEWANDREIVYLAGLSPYPLGMFEIELWYQKVKTDPNSKIFAIKTKKGDYIGNIEITSIDWRCAKGEMGLIIGEKHYWARDFGEDAVKTLVKFCFEEMNFNRISVQVLEHNKRAIKCFEKCGFQKEGILREAFLSRGKFCNIILMGILRHEFKNDGEKEGNSMD